MLYVGKHFGDAHSDPDHAQQARAYKGGGPLTSACSNFNRGVQEDRRIPGWRRRARERHWRCQEGGQGVENSFNLKVSAD
ncbi:hypothetical protein WJX77_003150 [Trebouxia sp. C0004]